jgi:hypothetical protein
MKAGRERAGEGATVERGSSTLRRRRDAEKGTWREGMGRSGVREKEEEEAEGAEGIAREMAIALVGSMWRPL